MNRLCTDHLRKVVKGKGTQPHGRYSVLAAACNGLWDNAKLFKANLALSPFCPKCGALDGVQHRAWVCPDPEVV